MLANTHLKPTKTQNKEKRRLSTEDRNLAKAALNAFGRLKGDEYWIKKTQIELPHQWLDETNKMLSEHHQIKNLQDLLLSLPLP
jgi:hypothetical protein